MAGKDDSVTYPGLGDGIFIDDAIKRLRNDLKAKCSKVHDRIIQLYRALKGKYKERLTIFEARMNTRQQIKFLKLNTNHMQ